MYEANLKYFIYLVVNKETYILTLQVHCSTVETPYPGSCYPNSPIHRRKNKLITFTVIDAI